MKNVILEITTDPKNKKYLFKDLPIGYFKCINTLCFSKNEGSKNEVYYYIKVNEEQYVGLITGLLYNINDYIKLNVTSVTLLVG